MPPIARASLALLANGDAEASDARSAAKANANGVATTASLISNECERLSCENTPPSACAGLRSGSHANANGRVFASDAGRERARTPAISRDEWRAEVRSVRKELDRMNALSAERNANERSDWEFVALEDGVKVDLEARLGTEGEDEAGDERGRRGGDRFVERDGVDRGNGVRDEEREWHAQGDGGRSLKEANERNARLEARVAELEIERDEKEREIASHAARVQSAVREAVRDSWARVDSANVALVAKEKELFEAETAASESRRAVIELETNLKRVEDELRIALDAQARRDVEDESKNGLMELAASAQGALAEALECKLAAALDDVQRLTEALEVAQDTANEKAYYESENTRVESELDEARREIAWRKAGEAELRSALDRSEGEIVLRKAELAKFEGDIEAKVEAKDNEIAQLRDALESAEQQLATKFAWASAMETELTKLRVEKFEFENALQNVTIDGSTKTHKLKDDLAIAMINVEDLTSALEAMRYELKQTQVEKESAIMDMNHARQQAAEALDNERSKVAEIVSELENAVSDCDRMRSELDASRERENDLLSQLDDAFIAAKLADEEADVEEEEYSQDDPEDDPKSPTPVKRTQTQVSSSPSRRMSVANLVATNRDLVEQLSRQSNEISRQSAQNAKMSAQLRGFESVADRLAKLKEDNLDLASKYKASVQKLSEENKVRRCVEMRFNEYELSFRKLDQTIADLREELKQARARELQLMANAQASEANGNLIDELRAELRDMKKALETTQREKLEILETHRAAPPKPAPAPQVSDSRDNMTYADFLAQEASLSERELDNEEAYAARLNEEIAKMRDEAPTAAAPNPKSEGLSAGEVLLALSETREQAKYYKTVAKTCYAKFQEQKKEYERRLAKKSTRDIPEMSEPTPRTPQMSSKRTPISAFAKKHAFLLEST